MGIFGFLGFLQLLIVTSIFDALQDIIQGVIGIFTTLFDDDGILSIFYTTTDGLKFLGVLLLIGFGFGITRWAFNFIKKMLQMRG